MNELGIAKFKANVQVGDIIRVGTTEIGYNDEKLSYHGEIIAIRDKDFILRELVVEFTISYKSVYWHCAE